LIVPELKKLRVKIENLLIEPE